MFPLKFLVVLNLSIPLATGQFGDLFGGLSPSNSKGQRGSDSSRFPGSDLFSGLSSSNSKDNRGSDSSRFPGSDLFGGLSQSNSKGQRGSDSGRFPGGDFGGGFLSSAVDRGEELLSGVTRPLNRFPLVGACDRIAYRGVMNCMENFLPNSVLRNFDRGSNAMCCSYYKYNACIFGLHDGLRTAMELEKCPKSYSTRVIRAMGDGLVGGSIKSLCQSFDGGRCGSRTLTKKKKNSKRPPPQPQEDDQGLRSPVDGLLSGVSGALPFGQQ